MYDKRVFFPKIVLSAFLFSLTILMLISCSSIPHAKPFQPFQHADARKFGITFNDLKKVQLYLSDTLILHHDVVSKDTKVTPGHTLKIYKGKLVEEVIIKKETPGVLVAWSNEYHGNDFIDSSAVLFVSFEPNHYLAFASTQMWGLQIGWHTTFHLYGGVTNKGGALYTNAMTLTEKEDYEDFTISKVPYGGKIYLIVGKYHSFLNVPYLLVDSSQISKYEKTSRIVPGIKLK